MRQLVSQKNFSMLQKPVWLIRSCPEKTQGNFLVSSETLASWVRSKVRRKCSKCTVLSFKNWRRRFVFIPRFLGSFFFQQYPQYLGYKMRLEKNLRKSQVSHYRKTPNILIAGLPRARSARGTEPHTHGIWSTSFHLVVT